MFIIVVVISKPLLVTDCLCCLYDIIARAAGLAVGLYAVPFTITIQHKAFHGFILISD